MKQLCLVHKKSITTDELLTMIVRSKFDNKSPQQKNQSRVQRTNISNEEGKIEVKSGSDIVTVFLVMVI